MHPIRLGYKLLSDRNPAMVPIPVMADVVKANRNRAGENNPFVSWKGCCLSRSFMAWTGIATGVTASPNGCSWKSMASLGCRSSLGCEPETREPCRVLVPSTDERNFQRLKVVRAEIEPNIDLMSFKALVREQLFILKLDSQAALEALPALLAGQSAAEIDDHFRHIEHVALASGPLDEKSEMRLSRVRSLFNRSKPKTLNDASSS